LKRVFLVSVLLALIVGPLIALSNSVLWLRDAHKYAPPITEAEWRQLGELPAARMALALADREVRLTRMQWLWDSVGHLYFWKSLAKSSVVPTLGVFFSCICLGGLEGRRRVKPPLDFRPASPD
jgi:hypothetical protein